MTFFAPTSDSTVRSIKSSRACTSTCNQTSSGARFSSMSRRLKVNSVFDADGKPTSISLKPHLHERLEQFELLADVHRHGERLVAVAQIHAAPARRAGEDAVGPLPVRQRDRRERTIFFRRIFEHVCLVLIGAVRQLAKQKPHRRFGSGV